MKAEYLGQFIHAFFVDYLLTQKGLRPASLRSYRDVLKLFLCFVARSGQRRLTKLTVADLSLQQVLDFLNHLEKERGNSIRTRNHRRTVLNTFFEYVARRVPEVLAVSQQVAAIPTKRISPPETHYLEHEDVAALFRKLPADGPHALRDRGLLLFLYNTGARVQEAADVRVGDLDLGAHPRVRIHGKGDKWRTTPMWTVTVQAIQGILANRSPSPTAETHVFAGRSGRPLTRFGIYKIVRRHTTGFMPDGCKPPGFAISPHTFRHTAAVHLLESGTDVNVIRGWLGHVSLTTTNRYAEINAKVKQAALLACQPPISSADEYLRNAVWKDDTEVLKWLDSL